MLKRLPRNSDLRGGLVNLASDEDNWEEEGALVN